MPSLHKKKRNCFRLSRIALFLFQRAALRLKVFQIVLQIRLILSGVHTRGQKGEILIDRGQKACDLILPQQPPVRAFLRKRAARRRRGG